MLHHMLVGDGELAQHILSWLSLRALARLAIADSLWAAEVAAALLAPQRWERYHDLLLRLKGLAPSDSSPRQLVVLVDEIDSLCGRLDVQALADLRAGRPFVYPPCVPTSMYSFPQRPCFMQREPGDSWHQRRPVARGTATDIAFFFSRVIPAAFQREVHSVFRAVAWRMGVVEFVALLRQASDLIDSSRFSAARQHLYSTEGFFLDKPKMLDEYGRGSINVVFIVPHERRAGTFHGTALPRCRSDWSFDQIVDAVLGMGFDVDMLSLIPNYYHRTGEILQALVDGGRVFGVQSDQQVAGILLALFTFEDDRMDDLARYMRDGGRVRYPPSLMAIVTADYAESLFDNFQSNRYNREVAYTLMEDVVEPIRTFLHELHFPEDFSVAEQLPILDALSRCQSEMKEGISGIALRWVHNHVGARGDAQLSADSLDTVRAICEALLS